MPCVYILYSPTHDKYYIGAITLPVENRLERHLDKYYEKKFTEKISDWELFFNIDCDTMKQAMQIEKHIKQMKSKKYIHDLKKFPEIPEKLKLRYVKSWNDGMITFLPGSTKLNCIDYICSLIL